MPEKGAAEAPAGGDLTPAQIAIVPCEVMIRPGDKVNFETVFTTRLANSANLACEVCGASGGTIDGDGVLSSANVKNSGRNQCGGQGRRACRHRQGTHHPRSAMVG